MSVLADRRLIFLLNAGHRRVQRWIEGKMAAKGGLTAAQSGVLFYLGERDGALIGEAADALDLAPSAMTGLIDRMTRAELVERQADPKGLLNPGKMIAWDRPDWDYSRAYDYAGMRR